MVAAGRTLYSARGVSRPWIAGDQGQTALAPVALADLLPPDHDAFAYQALVNELDLSEFTAAYRADGQGGHRMGCPVDSGWFTFTRIYLAAPGRQRRPGTRRLSTARFSRRPKRDQDQWLDRLIARMNTTGCGSLWAPAANESWYW